MAEAIDADHFTVAALLKELEDEGPCPSSGLGSHGSARQAGNVPDETEASLEKGRLS